MNGSEIREKFLSYFVAKEHTLVPSAALVPHDDPTLLFTNAGMVQFKKVFTGEERRDYPRAVSCQRCVRAGGKHNDLDNVGYTARHHTFFEMLGNFSFGDYSKDEAIRLAWDFLTREIGLSPTNLWVSVFEDDDEAYQIWEKIADLPPGHIVRRGEQDNFWAMGDTGPCGPCSEIHVDQGRQGRQGRQGGQGAGDRGQEGQGGQSRQGGRLSESRGLNEQGAVIACDNPSCGVGCDCDRFLEIWNLVFMQYDRDASGRLTPLPRPSIDTGMGLERIAAVAQGKHNNYHSDLFQPIISRICELAGVSYGENSRNGTALRVIADHARATTFLVADGVLPTNEGRGYVLRRIMRRAVRFGRSLGLKDPFLGAVCATVVATMEEAWPHLTANRELLAKVVCHEEERFLATLDKGLNMLAEEIARLRQTGEKTIAGSFIFKLYDTYGFPVDIAKDVAQEEGLRADEQGFVVAMARQREQSRKSWKGGGSSELGPGLRSLQSEGVQTEFVGYATRRHHATLLALLGATGNQLAVAEAGALVSLICDQTPFYAESGGQVGDEGEILGPQGRARVFNTVKIGDSLILHQAEISRGTLRPGEEVRLAVADNRRRHIAIHHTATHLLHGALRRVLGEHVKQAGSLVEARRLRFDFTHFSPLTREEIRTVEDLVNEEIRANTRLEVATLQREEALQSGAAALFGEKYGEMVRVVTVGVFSKELCGGTHVGATGEIGLCKIIAESGIAVATRRIEACCGGVALVRTQALEDELYDLAVKLKTSPTELAGRIDKLLMRQKELERRTAGLMAEAARFDPKEVLKSATEVDGVKVVARCLPVDSVKTLRVAGDRLRDQMGSGIVVLIAELDGKVSLLAMVSKDLTGRYRAGEIVKRVAELVGGHGGGRPDMAQAGGNQPAKIPAALTAVPGIVATM